MTGPSRPRIVSEMFAEWRPEIGVEVPFNEYQEYSIRRHRRTTSTSHDVGRFASLMWYIEAYGPSRLPLRIPLGGRQIRWLLESGDVATEPRPMPRIVEWFRRRAPDLPNPYEDIDAYVEIVFWWCVERSVSLGVEHALIPDIFVSTLTAPVWGAIHAIPVNEFLRTYARRHPEIAWDFTTQAQRLGAYMRLLMEPGGVHLALFFPPEALARIGRLGDGAIAAAGVGDAGVLKRRAVEAQGYRDQHGRLRSGAYDTCASVLGQDWMTTGWTPPPSPRSMAPISAQARASALPFPVRVIGPVNSRSGLGQAARQSISALESAGVAVETVDFVLDNPAPRGDLHTSVIPSAAPFAVNLLHLNAESLPLAPAYMSTSVFESAYNIGYFFWELPQPARCHHLALRQVDEVWVSSEFNRQTYAPHTAAPVCTVGMAVEMTDAAKLVPPAEIRRTHDLPPSSTVFITTFDSFSFMSRKNPAGVIRAFLAAFPRGDEDVRLVVKTHNLLANLGEVEAEALRREVLTLCGKDRRILLINETLAHAEVMALKAACDVYVSLHRSEGWGFGMLEGMQLGLPSIATSFSGNMDFCTEETAWLVPWTQRYLEPDEYIFVRPGDWWAEPDLPAAAAAMREAAADRDATRAKGAAARAFAETRFSPAAVGARYLERLQAIGAAKGLA